MANFMEFVPVNVLREFSVFLLFCKIRKTLFGKEKIKLEI